VDRADRSAATVRMASRIACSLASSCANVNDFSAAAILASHSRAGAVPVQPVLWNDFRMKSDECLERALILVDALAVRILGKFNQRPVALGRGAGGVAVFLLLLLRVVRVAQLLGTRRLGL
jgi:hypothetical protein